MTGPPDPMRWDAPDAEIPRPRIDPRHLTRLALPCSVLYVIATVGGFMGPTLVNDQPELLLALSSRNRHLLLTVASGISPISYFVIAAIRLAIPAPFFYLLGRDYGHRGIGWIERQTQGQTGYLGWVQRAFAKAQSVLLVLMPNSFVWMLAGMERVNRTKVVVLGALGIAGRLVLFWWAGKEFEEPLKDALDFIQRYQWLLVGALVAVSMVQATVQARRQAAQLASDLDSASDRAASESDWQPPQQLPPP